MNIKHKFCPLSILAVLLLAALPAFADVRIVGKTEAAPYTLVRLAAEGDVLDAALVWEVSPEGAADVEENGGRLIFTGPPGVYRVRVLSIRIRDGKPLVESARATVMVGAPTPPVPPGPPHPPEPIPPGPSPGPVPIPGDGLRVLIVEESADRSKLPAAQQAVIFSKTVRDYLNAKCAPDPIAGWKAWRIFDPDVDLSGEAQVWKDALKRPRGALPWIIISNPKKGGFEGPLPENVQKTLDLLKQYGD
jgi:hypothetical protein